MHPIVPREGVILTGVTVHRRTGFGGEGRLDVIREQERTIVRISFPAEP